MQELTRVVNTIIERLEKILDKEYPLYSKMVPSKVKQLIKDAISGAYASGYAHGEKVGAKINVNKGESK